MWRGLSAAVLLALLTGCGANSSASDPAGPSPSPSPTASAAFQLLAQVFLPPASATSGASVPLIVLVPGGGWQAADPAGFSDLAGRLTTDGSAVVTTTYRTQAQVAVFPVPVQDVVCAVDEAAARVAESGVTVGQVVVVGHSAGAQLAALAALVGDRYQADCPSPHVTVNGLVGLAGPYDLREFAQPAGALIDTSPTDDPKTWREASPITQVAERPELPVLLLHGQADDTVPPSTSKDFAAALKGAGHDVTLDLFPGIDHFTVVGVDVAAQPIEDFVASLEPTG